MIRYFLTIVIFCSICIGTSFAGNSTREDCKKLSGVDCQTCLDNRDCGYCQTSKECFLYVPSSLADAPCGISEQKYQTCIGNFKVWIIVISVLAGVILLAVIITVCCVCRKCKKSSIRREERRQQRQEERVHQQNAERQTTAEARTAERAQLADQLRMKYGILKDKETAEYSRMP